MLITIFSSLVLSGGQEEILEKQQDLQSRNQETEAMPRSVRTTNHAYVTTMRRNKSAIRVEIRESASNFLKVNAVTTIHCSFLLPPVNCISDI